MKILDMIGRPCPIPMISAKRELIEYGANAVIVLVDNEISVQNLEKMARGYGLEFSYRVEGPGRYAVTVGKGISANAGAPPEDAARNISTAAETAPQAVLEDTTRVISVPVGPAGTAPQAAPKETKQIRPDSDGLVVMIGTDHMGEGSDELGRILMKGFIYSLTQLAVPPESIIFLNGGAHLTSVNSNVVPDLSTLWYKGVEILTCGACVNYYGLEASLAVGVITDMMTITERAASAERLVVI